MTLSTVMPRTRHTRGGTERTLLLPARTDRTALLAPPAPSSVNRGLVHRTHHRDVIPTGFTQHTGTQFTVATRWPAEHRLYTDHEGHYTPSLVIETIRQCAMLLAHATLGVPVGHEFVVWDMSHRIDPQVLRKGPQPTELELDLNVHTLRRRGAVPAEVRVQIMIRRAEEVVGTGSAHYSVTSPGAYRRLRGERADAAWPAVQGTPPAAPMTPASVRRVLPADVTLAPGDRPGRWMLRTDTTNQLLFDHANDHVPAMVLLEAAQQAVGASPGTAAFRPSSCEVTCTRYVEFDTPCWIETHQETGRNGTTSVRVVGHQDDQVVFVIRFDQVTTAR